MNLRFVYWVFNAALLPFYPLLVGYLLWRRFVQKKSSASVRGQLGDIPREVVKRLHNERSDAPVIWLHAVSVGEQVAARSVARALKKAIPECKIALSVTTDTGFQTAQSTLEAGEADVLFYFPLDWPFAVSRVLKTIRPDIFLSMETELWPNLLHLAHARGVLCFLVNGRVSDNLLRQASKAKWLWRWMLFNLNGLLMRSEFDAERMQEIIRQVGQGSMPPRVLMMGDVKLDGLQNTQANRALRAKWRAELGIGESEVLWVCGSTHPGEEASALRVFKKLQAKFPNLKLLLAPRHIDRTAEVKTLIESEGFEFGLRSKTRANSPKVLLLDTVGELADIYAAADIAFVGGSLIPRGGHNLLEPLLKGIPVLFGPHTANFRAHAELIQNVALGNCVQNEGELAGELISWLDDKKRRDELPARIASALAPHQGAPMRIAAYIAQQVKAKS